MEEATKYLAILHLNWEEPNINQVITAIKSVITNKNDFKSITLYSKKNNENFNINNEDGNKSENKNEDIIDKDNNKDIIDKDNNKDIIDEDLENYNELKKIIGIAEFKNKESAFEAYENLNDIQIYNLTFDLRFFPDDHQTLIKDLNEVYYETYENLFELDFDEKNVDDYIEIEGKNDFDYNDLLKDFKRESIKVFEDKIEKEDKFEIDLKDDRFKEFYEDEDFVVDKTTQAYNKNKNIEHFLEEKSKRED